MHIDLDIMFSHGAIAIDFKKNEIIFSEDEMAHFYYQIVEGCVRMFNSNEEGKEYTQGNFYNGQSFGVPPLFINERYPATAVAVKNCKIIKLSKDSFLNILDIYPIIQKRFLILMAQRIHEKVNRSKEIINHKPEFRILAFLNAQKNGNWDKKELVQFTRQEIANFTGLRVETVIRVIGKMKAANKIQINDHKIYF